MLKVVYEEHKRVKEGSDKIPLNELKRYFRLTLDFFNKYNESFDWVGISKESGEIANIIKTSFFSDLLLVAISELERIYRTTPIYKKAIERLELERLKRLEENAK